MIPRVAIIILSRNLPERVDKLVREFRKYDLNEADIFVIEAGTDRELLSEHHTTWANWPEAMQEGLRSPRGFNLGLLEVIKRGDLQSYDYFFLVRGTVDLEGPVVTSLIKQMQEHPKLGIISPCGSKWEERQIIGDNSLRYVWHINHYAWMIRRELVELLVNYESPSIENLFFDGSNFRGYGTDTEIVFKGYANEYATALSTTCFLNEDTSLLKTQADLIRTDPYDVNARKVFDEGFRWMKHKYGFTTRLQFQELAELWYERFFELHPSLEQYKLVQDESSVVTEPV